jgi:hypothetical protein
MWKNMLHSEELSFLDKYWKSSRRHLLTFLVLNMVVWGGKAGYFLIRGALLEST